MKKSFIAVSRKGAEFAFKRDTMIAVPESSKAAIVAALNAANYHLQPGETWHAHENDFYYNQFITVRQRPISPGSIPGAGVTP